MQCPLCTENGLMTTIVASSEQAYVCRRVDRSTGTPVMMEGEYLLVPFKHVAMWLPTLSELHDLLGAANIDVDNLSINLTKQGGRTLDHAHIHAIVRGDGRNLGMNGLIALTDALELRVAHLEAALNDVRQTVREL